MFERNLKVTISALMVLFFLSATASAAGGFGQYTTGGAGGATVTVTNAADFRTYVETVGTPYIVQVSGTIALAPVDGRVRIQSNKTIRGIGENPTIIGSLGFKNDCSNVIIERLNITCPKDYTSEEDGVSIKERITNVIVTKCSIYDSWDGLLDISRQSDFITVSWCKFYYTTVNNGNNNRVSLIGNTDSSGDEGTLRVTFHHNWFGSYCLQRIPSVRYGKAHVYNNYYYFLNSDNYYAIWSRIKAECLIENNYFKEVNNPYYNIDYYGEDAGKISASGNILDNCIGQIHPGTDSVFSPPYSYTLDDAKHIPAIVQYGAGADGLDGYPPHWVLSVYGDFDLNDIVDENDLIVFADYWLETTNIDDADYYDDGIVNGREFALFAGNWLEVPPDLTAPGAPSNLWALGSNGIVSLDWSDNNEPDFEGYNIYRSTDSASGYTKLNSSLLISSNFIDDTVTNDTMYYYIVTALDSSENESNNSAQACAVPNSETDTITLQENATGFCGVDGIIDTKHEGYTGSGFCDTTNANGAGINWNINIASAGTYTFVWRFANGSTDRSAKLIINGSDVLSGINFPATGAWANWDVLSADIALTSGIKSIRLEATNSDGLANIDYLMLAGAAPEIAPCQ